MAEACNILLLLLLLVVCRLPVLHRLRGIMIHAVMGFLSQRMRLFLLHESL